MKYQDVLLTAAKIPVQRQTTYGDPSETYSRAATIAATMLDKSLTARDIVLILHAVKLARMTNDTTNEDNYFDAINYLAMATELSPISDVVGFDPAKPGSDKNVLHSMGPVFRVPAPSRQPQPRFLKTPPGDFDDGGNLSKGDEA